MTRFFVSSEVMAQDCIVLDGDNALHAKVLRLKIGEELLICDGQGKECLCTVTGADSSAYMLQVTQRRESKAEASVRASIYMALPKADKLEHVIQKATELGVYEIVTLPSARCVSKPDDKSLIKKLERWQKIAASAAEQSGRGRIPEVLVLNSYSQALERAVQSDISMVFYENEHAHTLHQALSAGSFQTISMISGPEGGFEEEEILLAEQKGLQICTLGSRILRCETAPLCALSAVMYHIGEF